MSDETINPESSETPAAPAAPAVDVAALQAQHAAELAAARAELDAHKQTLAAVQTQLGGGGQPQMVQAGQYQVPRDLVQQYMAQGHSEADAITLVKAILPALSAYGAPVVQQMQQSSLETKFIRAAMDKANHPDWELLSDTIGSLRTKYPGIEPTDAYTWARGLAYDKVKAADESRRAAEARGADATAQSYLSASPHTRIDFNDTVIRSAADIEKLSDEQAQKLWDQLGDKPF
jgi:hypothetical protein